MAEEYQATGHSRQKLTVDERKGMSAAFNLADGHARNSFPSFWSAVRNLDQNRVGNLLQKDLEDEFIESFLGLLGQAPPADRARMFILPSASLSLEVIANLLRIQGTSLIAPEPCFDNLFDIFRRHAVMGGTDDASIEGFTET